MKITKTCNEIKGKIVSFRIQEKIWIIKQKADNENIKQTKIAVDFQAKFKRPVTRQCICQILQNKVKILQTIGNDPELNVKKMKHFKKVMNTTFEADLVRLIDEKYKRMNISHEIIRLCAQVIQKRPEYLEDSKIQSLKFSPTYITAFMKTHGLRHI